jgi:hypothetical protein
MPEPIVRLKKRTPLVSLSRERFAALQTEVKLLREVVKACDSVFNDEGLELTAAFKVHEKARAALEAFDSARDKEKQ